MNKPQKEKRTLLLTAICAVGMMLCVYLLLCVFPFGEQTVITGDLNGQYISYNAQFASAIKNGGDGITYTLQKQMGGSMLGILAYYCASPLNLLYLLVPTVHYAKLAGLILLLKVVFSAVTMAFFVNRKNTGLNHRAILIGICYAFCNYIFVYSQNIMWMDVLVLLPIICYGIDVLVNTKRPFIFSLSLGLAIFANFYIAYMACIFAVLYFGYTMVLSPLLKGDMRQKLKFWLWRCGSFAFGALCAGGIASILIVPAMMDISQNKGLATSFQLTGQASFKLSEFFYRLLPFSFTWADVENGLPNVYCGTLIIVLFVAYFACKNISIKEKLLSGAMTLILFITLYSADIALVMHGFVTPVWFLYRHAFLFAFWLVFLGARALSSSAQLNIKGFIISGAIGVLFLLICFFVRNVWFTATLFLIGAILCAVCLCLVFILKNAKNQKIRLVAFSALAVFCAVELTANAYFNLNQFEKYSDTSFTSFVSHGKSALSQMEEYAEESGINYSAYRAEKAFFRTHNDPMLLGYNGLSHFGSTQDSTVVMWLSHLGFGSTNTYSPGSTAFAESISGLKWLYARSEEYLKQNNITTNNNEDLVPEHYIQIGTTQQGLNLYENPYAMPIAFFADESVAKSDISLTWDFGMCQTFDIQNQLFNTLSTANGILFTDLQINATLDGEEKSSEYGQFTQNATFTAEVLSDGLVYAVFESEENRPVLLSGNVYDDGYFAGKSTGVLQLGRHKKGDTVTIAMQPEWGIADVTKARICVMDEKLLEEYTQSVNKNAPQISTTASTITVTANAQSGQLLVLSVPYSSSLEAQINGNKAEIIGIFSNCYTGVILNEGENLVEITYNAKGSQTGIILTAISVLLLILAYIYFKRSKQNGSVYYS